MKTYQHTQRGTAIVLAMLIVSVGMLLGAIVYTPTLLAIPILMLCGWLFHSMKIEITDSELRWCFGPGLIQKHVVLDQIVSAEPVRIKVRDGWGIHLTRFGWLYNVSGFDAVVITLKNGKRFCLGTDDPHRLASILDGSRFPSPSENSTES
ncbi:MAG: hypothetical protein QOF48_783 [Verrucomicrobiota bacterium]|jgi:hypothetical protein